MYVQVRRRMLESLRQCEPGSIGRNISKAHWVASMFGNLTATSLTVLFFYSSYQQLVVRCGLGLVRATVLVSGSVIAITAALYIYYVYIVDSGSPSKSSTSKKSE